MRHTRYLVGDARTRLQELAPGSVHVAVTSPPYFQLRLYGEDPAEIGRERRPADYLESLMQVFRPLRDVLRPDGLLFINLGDSYARRGGTGYGDTSALVREAYETRLCEVPEGYQQKSLLGMPWRLAFALIDEGWILRAEIVWEKTNGKPESITDRPTRSHETIFMFARQGDHYADMDGVREAHTMRPQRRLSPHLKGLPHAGMPPDTFAGLERPEPGVDGNPLGRNLRSVWPGPVSTFRAHELGIRDQDHYGTMPEWLAERLVRIGTSEKGCCSRCGACWRRAIEAPDGSSRLRRSTDAVVRAKASPQTGGTQFAGRAYSHWRAENPHVQRGWQPGCDCAAGVVPCTVLDPFGGAGTTAVVASRLGQHSILIDLNPDYAELTRKRLLSDASMFNDVTIEEDVMPLQEVAHGS